MLTKTRDWLAGLAGGTVRTVLGPDVVWIKWLAVAGLLLIFILTFRAWHVEADRNRTLRKSLDRMAQERHRDRERLRAYEASEEYAELHQPDGTVLIYRRSNIVLTDDVRETTDELEEPRLPDPPAAGPIGSGLTVPGPGLDIEKGAGEDRLPWTLGPGYSAGGWAALLGYEIDVPVAPGWSAYLTPSATWGPKPGFEVWLPIQLGRRRP